MVTEQSESRTVHTGGDGRKEARDHGRGGRYAWRTCEVRMSFALSGAEICTIVAPFTLPCPKLYIVE